ncbi:MAG TPA: 23S rRNA (pseudouridine(1915)-N(3))-methyltransferase RlmH [Longimicrobiaceae bacterium]|nr:23S rRNA (pseudouridine(1915)-N(3))-methyltransferase RlmH [Longimicrobiaceae bacterium]
MKLVLLSVGRPRRLFADAIAEYEARAGRYFRFEAADVREEPLRREGDAERVMGEEGKRLLARIPERYHLVALHRGGEEWSSERLARYLGDASLGRIEGVAFVIGGALGLAPEVLQRADVQLALSTFTLPHELARLVLAEQIYRAGTILRGEPYHKGRSS